jgi:hypothetical protein
LISARYATGHVRRVLIDLGGCRYRDTVAVMNGIGFGQLRVGHSEAAVSSLMLRSTLR